MGLLLSNTVPVLLPGLQWPARTASLELISSYALSIFLAMSLMSMQLWTLAGMAGTLLILVAVQTVVAITYILLVVFPTPGRDCQAAVLSGGFTGLSLGSTPTAIACMSAITKNYGPAPNASSSCRWSRRSSLTSSMSGPSRFSSSCDDPGAGFRGSRCIETQTA